MDGTEGGNIGTRIDATYCNGNRAWLEDSRSINAMKTALFVSQGNMVRIVCGHGQIAENCRRAKARAPRKSNEAKRHETQMVLLAARVAPMGENAYVYSAHQLQGSDENH